MDGAEPRGAGLAIYASAEDVEAARLGFHRAFPRRSAKRVFHVTQVLAIAAVVAAIVWACRAALGVTLEAVHIAALALFAIAIAFRLAAASNLAPILSRLSAPAQWPVYTILCPLYREANVIADLIASLEWLDYPNEAIDIKLLVESDDRETIAAALAGRRQRVTHRSRYYCPPARHAPSLKRSMLAWPGRAASSLLIYDAEDRPHAQQLSAALAAFDDGGAELACVQAPLAIDNADALGSPASSRRNTRSSFARCLPLLAYFDLPLPLGGTSNHFRTEASRQCGGWDPYNVTEDADLGYRFARDGYRQPASSARQHTKKRRSPSTPGAPSARAGSKATCRRGWC